jgi:hypothetical protein
LSPKRHLKHLQTKIFPLPFKANQHKINKLRRFEILLPLQFNDGREVPSDWLAEAVLEIVEQFDAASYETQKVEGHWRHQGILYRDNLVKIVIDAPDEEANREWMRKYKARWKEKLEQLDLWLVSYTIDVD